MYTLKYRLNEPRYPSIPNIMKAKKKPMDKIDISGNLKKEENEISFFLSLYLSVSIFFSS